MIIPVKVKKRILTCKKPLVSENVETYSVSISVDEEWEGFNTRVIFYNSSMEIGDNNPKNVVTQNIDEVTIPWEVLQESGYLYLTLIGTRDTEVIKTKEMDSPIIVNKAGMSEGGTPFTPILSDTLKATVEDATAGINKTELISLIKDNLQIKSVSTGLKFENGVLSLDIANGDNLKYGTLTQSTETNENEVVSNE